MHDQGIFGRLRQAFLGQAVKVVIFPGGRDELPTHALGLKSKHHDHVRAVQCSIEIVINLGAHRLDTRRHQCRGCA